VAVILLTHGHPDHSDGARTLHELTGAPVRALDPTRRLGSEGLAAGDVVAVAGVEVHALATPGHTSDSLSFLLPDGGLGAEPSGRRAALLTGDTILGQGTTVIAYPDGRLADYLASLCRLRDLDDATVLPGHGPVLPSTRLAAEAYLAHRHDRLGHVRAALAAAGATAAEAVPADVVRVVYSHVDPALWPAAELSVRAQLDYLRHHG
jgi:glyoxylase-like metal-dependent hydrolase (beta-lactamase superfamily II)